jgi:exodeoxyribonuclease V beta subunit
LLRGRRIGEAVVPNRCAARTIPDEEALARFREWEAAGGPVIEPALVGLPAASSGSSPPFDIDVRKFHRTIDTAWRRTSYTALTRLAEAAGVSSEPEVSARDDEVETVAVSAAPVGAQVLSPMADLPGGTAFGSLVHAVLENADPTAPDLQAELDKQVREHLAWWAVDAPAEVLAPALVPMHDTPLGPLAPGLTLRQIGLPDRLRELDFEIPLAGGDLREMAPQLTLSDVGRLLRKRLRADDPLAPYADRLRSDGYGTQSLRGYLSGSIDAVLRIPDRAGHRYVIVDYKTNKLGETAADYALPRLTEAMLHSDYPLQALLYAVVLHRFLRWRVRDYAPRRHLGGVMYLFVRGMCGAGTPVLDGHPCGVFSWHPPASVVMRLSDVLELGRLAG